MNFKIIEQEPQDLEEKYSLFKQEYMNPNQTVAEVKKKLNLSNSEYKHLREQLQKETGIEVKPHPYNKTGYYNYPRKYIHKREGAYEIRKGRKYYGRFKEITEAQKMRDELIKNNWEIRE